MQKIVVKIVILFVLLAVLMSTEVFAYENEIFKCDLPDSYINLYYDSTYLFVDNEDSKKGFVIYVIENKKNKESIWDFDSSLIEKKFFSNNETMVNAKEKTKLGKEKAIKYIFKNDNNSYTEFYLLTSNNYIYTVGFIGDSISDLENNDDYAMIKKSFKLKDKTTDLVTLYFVVLIITVVIILSFIYRKKSKQQSKYFTISSDEKPIDYKNMTEEDFKKYDNKL